jgi:hypothetical protein
MKFKFNLVPLLLLIGTGCGSLSEPSSSSFASVKIKGHSPEAIAGVTTQVFLAEGYDGGGSITTSMTFRKEGSRMSNLAYEGVVHSYYGARTEMRVKVEIVGLQRGVYRLQCQAYTVTGVGDSFYEEERRVSHMRRGPYQSMLDKVAKQLKESEESAATKF